MAIRKCDWTCQQMHELLLHEIDEIAVIVGGLPHANHKLAAAAGKIFMRLLLGDRRKQDIGRWRYRGLKFHGRIDLENGPRIIACRFVAQFHDFLQKTRLVPDAAPALGDKKLSPLLTTVSRSSSTMTTSPCRMIMNS
jgi:hypothetical protein